MDNNQAPYGRVNTVYDQAGQTGQLPVTPMPKETKKEILKVSGILGISILLFHFLSVWSGGMVVKLVNSGSVPYTYTVQQIIQILYTLLTILIPFAIGAFFVKKVQKRDELLPLGKPKSGILFVEALGIGLAAIVIANFVTAFLVQFCEQNGVTFDSYKPGTSSRGCSCRTPSSRPSSKSSLCAVSFCSPCGSMAMHSRSSPAPSCSASCTAT